MVTFFIEGTPVPQGSKNAYVRGRRAVVVETNKQKLDPWRANIARTAQQIGYKFPKDAPVMVDSIFIFERTKSVKRKHMSVKPDLDKLQRALNDGLTKSGIFGDDARIVKQSGEKKYGYPAGCWVTITEIKEIQ